MTSWKTNREDAGGDARLKAANEEGQGYWAVVMAAGSWPVMQQSGVLWESGAALTGVSRKDTRIRQRPRTLFIFNNLHSGLTEFSLPAVRLIGGQYQMNRE